MNDLLKVLDGKNITLPANIVEVLKGCKSITTFDSVEALCEAATGGPGSNTYDVVFDVPSVGKVVEATVNRVTNGIAANYTEPYMRRRDPNTMAIADDKPTDKDKFEDKYGYKFDSLQQETYEWLKGQDIAVTFYFVGNGGIGSTGIAIAPANAAFFAMGLAMLQQFIPVSELANGTQLKSAIFVAPTFRHTHFNGKQVVVHNRTNAIHEMYSYNLYPGPSAKKGLYGVLLTQGEEEGWVTAHCSAVQSVSPYDHTTTFMHEGASGGGKSELHQHIIREEDGQVLLGKNTISGEERLITIPKFCSLSPVADDMAFCHPSIQKNNGKLSILDAEYAWFVRVDGIRAYGDDPTLEKMSIHPPKPLLFLNVDAKPDSTALVWNHIQDEPGKACPNPRVIIPRSSIKNIVSEPVSVDVRSFGIRTPVCSLEKPTYGIVGLFHVLPPALAWLWRLVSPRGHNNPSIVGGEGMGSEGVGSYWPFATGKRIRHANLLLEQIMNTPQTTFILVPNQNVGVWKVGFKPQLLMREYFTWNGGAELPKDQYQPARCSLLGNELNHLTIEGAKIPSRFLKVYEQKEVGAEGYDAGAKILQEFFNAELPQYLEEGLSDLGRQIIEACLNGASVEDYYTLLPVQK